MQSVCELNRTHSKLITSNANLTHANFIKSTQTKYNVRKLNQVLVNLLKRAQAKITGKLKKMGAKLVHVKTNKLNKIRLDFEAL